MVISHPLIHPPGVFFGLAESEYHESLALSASGIKWLRVSSLDWWARSPLNPDAVAEESSDAMVAGSAYHKRILEGEIEFLMSYAPALDPADYPNVARTNEQLIDAIVRAGGIATKAMRKSELITLLLRIGGRETEIWECIVERHAAIHAGKILLSAELIKRIEVAAAMIEKHPTLSKAFTGGAAEVSIFWTDEKTGIPCKARLDYLKPRAIVDLKTFTNPYQMPIDTAVMRAIANYRYHLQAAFYLEAAAQLGRLDVIETKPGYIIEQPLISSSEAWAGDKTWLWVFQQQGISPIARGYVLGPGTIMDIARMEIAQAKAEWLRCWNTFGSDPWVDQSDIREIDPTELPAYIAT